MEAAEIEVELSDGDRDDDSYTQYLNARYSDDNWGGRWLRRAALRMTPAEVIDMGHLGVSIRAQECSSTLPMSRSWWPLSGGSAMRSSATRRSFTKPRGACTSPPKDTGGAGVLGWREDPVTVAERILGVPQGTYDHLRGLTPTLEGLERLEQIKYAVLERDGSISVIPRP